MSLLDMIKDLFGGASEHVDNLQNTVQNIGDSEVAQNLKDQAADVSTQAQDAAGTVGDKVQDATNNLKDKLPQ